MDPLSALTLAALAVKVADSLANVFVKIWKTIEEGKEEDPSGEIRAMLFDSAARGALYSAAEARTRSRLGLLEDEAIDPVELADDLPKDMARLVPMIREQMCLVMQPEKWRERT